ncbi:MAG: efflux RND transporter periplasmic adaptor subunit [Bacteroidales bacterium]|nr:efflux RND transporter periplasmic adaptor subunit [Bacteroidales bacterium]
MKRNVILVALLAFAVACSGPADKKSELAKLKKQHDELAVKIKTLESELNTTGEVVVKNLVNVVVTEAKPVEFNHYIEVQGKVDGEDNIAVSAQMPGAITAVYVKEGQSVRKGQVLAQIDNSVMQQQLANMEQQLAFVTNLYNKQKALWDQKIGSEVQFLTAKNNKESLEKNLDALKDQLEMTKIKSPINGSVEEVNLKVGQMASPGLPAVRVVNFNTVKVVAEMAEAYTSKIEPGNKVVIYFPDLKSEISSEISFTSKYINPVNRTFITEVKLAPGEIEYRANMIAVVKINDYQNTAAFTVPITLIRESPKGNFIYVARQEDGYLVARRLPVTIGRTYNGLAELLTGVTTGEKIITTGFNNLMDGQFILAGK